MLPFDDSRWKSLTGGYGRPYDASVPLTFLERGEDVWSELWEQLHHQGDLGTASYAAVPHIARIATAQRRCDWNPYAFVATIEAERLRTPNPEVPSWLKPSYEQAIQDLASLALYELTQPVNAELFVRSALAVVALARGARRLGVLLSLAESSEIDEILGDMYGFNDPGA